MSTENYNFEKGGINKHVNAFVKSLGDLTGKKVLDCPAGDGRTSYQFLKAGAEVTSADLFPQFFKLKEIHCDQVDLVEGLPYDDESFDIAICQEGIEHMPDQVFALQEFSRVLKKGGKLIMTTPSNSHLRARLSLFLNESEYYKRSAPNELDSIWFSEGKTDRLYYGHVFLLNALKLRTLSKFSGLKITKFVKTDIGTTSLLLLPIFYPFIVLFSLFPFLFYTKKLKHIDSHVRKQMMKEQFLLNCSPKTLVCKDLFGVFEKERSLQETIDYLKAVTRN